MSISVKRLLMIGCTLLLLPLTASADCLGDQTACNSRCAGNRSCVQFCFLAAEQCQLNQSTGVDAGNEPAALADALAQQEDDKRASQHLSQPITYQGSSTASFADQVQSCNVAESAAQGDVYRYFAGYLKTGAYSLSISGKTCECTSANRWNKTMYDCIGYATGVLGNK